MKVDVDVSALFQFPAVHLNADLIISKTNQHFADLFGDLAGQSIAMLGESFNQKRFERDIAAGKFYEFKVVPPHKIRSQYNIKLTSYEDGFVGVAIDTSSLAKLDALLTSYSELIERQNREIKAKNEQITIWRNRIESELEQAETVQDLLVPQHINTPNVVSRCKYLREMSGDFHELATHADGGHTLIVGDVAGKGIYAAIMLAQTLTAFRSACEHGNLTDVVASIIEQLEGKIPDGLFVALTLVHLSADQKNASILNLGNPAALFIDEYGVFEEIASVGPAIGILPAAFYRTLEVTQLDMAGKQLFVFSDGVLDINLGPDVQALEDSQDIAKYVLPMVDNGDEDIFHKLFEAVETHPQSDDIVISCVRSDA